MKPSTAQGKDYLQNWHEPIRCADMSPSSVPRRAYSYSLGEPLDEVVMIASVYTRVYNSVHVGTQLYTHVYTKQDTTGAQKRG